MIAEFNVKSYFISVWIKFDKEKELCSSSKTKRIYFVAYPHIISSTPTNNSGLRNQDSQFQYENIQTGVKININNLVNFNWNLITFHYHEREKTFKLIINNDLDNPAFRTDNANLENYQLRKILFCADNRKCQTNLNDFNLNDDYIWGSAYYKNMKIYEGVVENYINFQEREQYLNDLNLIPELFNVKYEIPFNTFNTDRGNILDISSEVKILDITSLSTYKDSDYYKSLDEFFPYSSKLANFNPTEKHYFGDKDSNGGNLFF
jgi:hypothetical protein